MYGRPVGTRQPTTRRRALRRQERKSEPLRQMKCNTRRWRKASLRRMWYVSMGLPAAQVLVPLSPLSSDMRKSTALIKEASSGWRVMKQIDGVFIDCRLVGAGRHHPPRFLNLVIRKCPLLPGKKCTLQRRAECRITGKPRSQTDGLFR